MIFGAICVSSYLIAGIVVTEHSFTSYWKPWLTHEFAPAIAPLVLWLAAIPLCKLIGRRRSMDDRDEAGRAFPQRPLTTMSMAICFGVCSLSCLAICLWFGWPLRQLPFSYHDEYSYLLSSQTFASGRHYFPAPEWMKHFREHHVITDGVFASKYFPGTGLWLTSFTLAGMSLAGCWGAASLSAGFVALTGCRQSLAAGYVAGLVTATAPAVIFFGNLHLSFAPSMLALSIFVWLYFGLFDGPRPWRGLWCGVAMGALFLTRPSTAVGLGFPFALYSVWRFIRARPIGYATTFASLVGGFVACLALLGAYNYSITGSLLKTPYQLYTDSEIPSHRFGFYNKEIGIAHRSASTNIPYDDHASNLTPAAAFDNVFHRVLGIGQQSLGLFVSTALAALAVFTLKGQGDRALLLVASFLGLLFINAPFWFAGIMGYSYQAESVPIFLLLAAMTITPASGTALSAPSPAMRLRWSLVLACVAAINVFHELPRVFDPTADLVRPMLRMEQLAVSEEKLAADGPTLILYDAPPVVPMRGSFVHNEPTLDGRILRGWYLDGDVTELLAAFPQRFIYVVRPPLRPGERMMVKKLRDPLPH